METTIYFLKLLSRYWRRGAWHCTESHALLGVTFCTWGREFLHILFLFIPFIHLTNDSNNKAHMKKKFYEKSMDLIENNYEYEDHGSKANPFSSPHQLWLLANKISIHI